MQLDRGTLTTKTKLFKIESTSSKYRDTPRYDMKLFYRFESRANDLECTESVFFLSFR